VSRETGPVLPRVVVVLVGLVAGFLVIAGLRGLAEVVGPIFLAFVLVIATQPMRIAAERHGIPGWVGSTVAVLWALLAFITNYIPNVGFVIGVVPPAVIGLLEGGPRLMIYVLLVYSVLNVVIQSVIQPKIVGDAVGLSSTITMVSLVFWAYTLGAMGALLAVPLTLFANALLVDADPGSRWLTPLMSGAAPGRRGWNGPQDALQARRAPRAPAGPRRGGAR
jgi:predicted PurR-regulated permease PerM